MISLCLNLSLFLKMVAEEQFDFALEKSETITVKSVEVTETSSFDLEDLDFDADQYNVTEAERSSVMIRIDNIMNGDVLDVNDYYDVITVKIDGSWYIAKLSDLGAEIKSDNPAENKDESGNTDSDYSSVGESKSDGNSYLDSETKKKLESLDTDYSKVNWGVQYSPFEDHPGIVISVAPYVDEYDTYKLIVGITNLLDTPVTISGGGEAAGKDGSIVGETYIYENAIGVGNTVIEVIYCDDVPDGRIHWTDLEVSGSDSRYVPWEADWELSNSDDFSEYTLNYNIYAEEPFVGGSICGLAVDQDGNVVYVFDTYEENPTSSLSDSITAYENLSARGLKDVALFINPLAE